MKTIHLFLTVALLFAAPFTALAGVRALLVGVGEYPETAGPQFPELGGPPNDVKMMKRWLVEDIGVPASSVRTLTNREATAGEIKSVFQSHLVEGGSEDDVVVFFFAGHGMQIPEIGIEGDEEDGKDEALVAYDYSTGNPDTWLTDDVIHEMLSTLKARHVLVIFDSCHAGTGTRSAGSPFAWYGHTRSTGQDVSMKQAGAPANHVFVASCGPGELSDQIYDEEGEMVGVFSRSFRAVARDHAAGPLSQFQDQLKKQVTFERKQSGKTGPQTPSVESERLDFSLSDFLSGKVFGSGGSEGEISTLENLSGFDSVGTIDVTLKTDQKEYFWGERMKVTVSVDKAAYLRVVHMDSVGNQLQIFPNKWQSQRLVYPGEELLLPPATGGYALQVGKPNKGWEMIMAIASDKPFTDEEAANAAEVAFQKLPSCPIEDTMRRGITIRQREPRDSLEQRGIGQAIKIYRVSEP